MTWELHLTTKEKETIVQIQKIRSLIRTFLRSRGFLEVDIPVILPSKSLLYGGIPISGQIINGYLCAVMTPFIRRWLVLSREFGISRAYFIGKCFRDEKTDGDHYPVFENLAIGVLGKDYNFLAEFVEKLVLMILRFTGKEKLLSWRQIPYAQLNPKTDFTNPEVNEDKALEEYAQLTANLSEPTFVTELPVQLFGPAKELSRYTKERAELFIRGIEIGNISTFLTNSKKLCQWYYNKGIDFNQYLIEKEHLESVSTLDGELMTTGAIGLSRLYVALLGLKTISQTVPFPYFGGK